MKQEVGGRIFVALILFVAANARAQSSSDAANYQNQLAAVIEKVRHAAPASDTLNEARTMAFALVQTGRYEDALAVFEAIRNVAPIDARAIYGSALASFNLQRIAEAERLARAAIEASDKSLSASRATSKNSSEQRALKADALVLLGVILAVKKDTAGALDAVLQAVKLAPENFDAQFALGRAYYGAGDLMNAVRAFRIAVKLRHVDARARFFLATALEGANDLAGALIEYRELIKFAPNAAEGHLGLGALLVKIGSENVSEGIRELQRAVELNANLYEAQATLGRALIHAGRASEAIEPLQSAAQLAPANPEPHYQLAIAYRKLGRKAEAVEESAIVKRIHETRRENTSATTFGAKPN